MASYATVVYPQLPHLQCLASDETLYEVVVYLSLPHPWPTRRYAYALVVCFPKVTPSSPSGGLAYPPQLLLRALSGQDAGLDE